MSLSAASVLFGVLSIAYVVPEDAPQRGIKLASEVRINQARGTLPAGTREIEANKTRKGAPENVGGGSANSGPTAPVTCNQQNASSPACYSATQQARPIAR